LHRKAVVEVGVGGAAKRKCFVVIYFCNNVFIILRGGRGEGEEGNNLASKKVGL